MDGSTRRWHFGVVLAALLFAPSPAGAVEVGASALRAFLQRAGGQALRTGHDGRSDTVRTSGEHAAVPPGTVIVGRIAPQPLELVIPGGFRAALPLEILTADAADSRLLGLRLVADEDYAAFHFVPEERRFQTEVRIGLVDTIQGGSAPLARPVVVQIVASEAALAEPTQFVIDHAGPPFLALRLADVAPRARTRLQVRSDLDGVVYDLPLPFEEPARVTLSRARIPGLGFGQAEVTIEGPEWAESTRIHLHGGRAAIVPSVVTLHQGRARARLFSRFLGPDSVLATSDRLSARAALVTADWPWSFPVLAVVAALVGAIGHSVRARRRRRPARERFAAALVIGVAVGVAAIGVLQWVPLPLAGEAVVLIAGALGGYYGARTIDKRMVPSPARASTASRS